MVLEPKIMKLNMSSLRMPINLFCFNIWLETDCSFYDRSAPIYTQPRHLPPSKVLDADVTDSVIGEGCVIKVSNVIVELLV
jgi:ADP-glucose pyrophosphorylase